MKPYDLTHVEEYFCQWYSPADLAGILRRIAMNLSIACLQAETPASELREDLEDLKTFVQHLERVRTLEPSPV